MNLVGRMIFFRADASIGIGTGHVMRCLTLAEQFRACGAEVQFICAETPGDLITLVEARGYPVHRVSRIDEQSEDASQTKDILRGFRRIDLLVIDHYSFSAEWEQEVKLLVGTLMVIDDLANRQHQCDVLLDQNLHAKQDIRYQSLIPLGCLALLGPKYALLRPEFAEARKISDTRTQINRVILTFGGSDPTGETVKALEGLKDFDIDIDVVVGASNPRAREIELYARTAKNVNYYYQATNMATLLRQADIAICAGGSTTWERFTVGLPGLVIAVADNQIPIAEASHAAGADIYLGNWRSVTSSDIRDSMKNLLCEPEVVSRLSSNAQGLVDGYGTERVINCIVPLMSK